MTWQLGVYGGQKWRFV